MLVKNTFGRFLSALSECCQAKPLPVTTRTSSTMSSMLPYLTVVVVVEGDAVKSSMESGNLELQQVGTNVTTSKRVGSYDTRGKLGGYVVNHRPRMVDPPKKVKHKLSVHLSTREKKKKQEQSNPKSPIIRSIFGPILEKNGLEFIAAFSKVLHFLSTIQCLTSQNLHDAGI